MVVELFSNFATIEFILPSEEVTSDLSVDHSADNISGPGCNLLVHCVLTAVEVFSSSLNHELVFSQALHHHEVFLSLLMVSESVVALLKSGHSVLAEESTCR